MKNFVKNFWQSFISLNQEGGGKQTNNQTNDPLHNVRNRDKFGKVVYQLIARPTFIIMSVSLQRILRHFSSFLSLIILKSSSTKFHNINARNTKLSID